jgi:hypothetical protein
LWKPPPSHSSQFSNKRPKQCRPHATGSGAGIVQPAGIPFQRGRYGLQEGNLPCQSVFFIVLAAVFIIMACNFPDSVVKLTVGPKYFPIGISILLIIASASARLRLGGAKTTIELKSPLCATCWSFCCPALFSRCYGNLGNVLCILFCFYRIPSVFSQPPASRGQKACKGTGHVAFVMQLVVYFVFQRLSTSAFKKGRRLWCRNFCRLMF